MALWKNKLKSASVEAERWIRKESLAKVQTREYWTRVVAVDMFWTYLKPVRFDLDGERNR